MLVFDATALAALIDTYPPVWAYWRLADLGQERIAVPALAIVEVGEAREVEPSQWEAILWESAVEVLPLTETVAKEIARWQGTLAARHALWEARQTGWPILTRDARLYPASVKLLIV